MKQRKLSNLEMTVLGLAWLRGPCSIYAIMKELSLSASSYHKSRAGTTYSIARRLLASGQLAPSNPEDHIVVTEQGLVALRQWVAGPIPMADVAHTADLLRLRCFFLGVVEPAERLRFIDESLAGLEIFLKRTVELIDENQAIGDQFGAIATVSSILETQARIRWLKLVREWIEKPWPAEQSWSEIVKIELGGL